MENSNRFKDQSTNVKTTQKRRARSQRFSRAKTGCFTCRARRKKCDETRDERTGSCQRCLKSAIECLGFPDLRDAPLAAHSKKEKAKQNNQYQYTYQSPILNTSTSLPINTDAAAGITHQVARIRSSPSVQHLHQTPSFDSSTGFEFSLGELLSPDPFSTFPFPTSALSHSGSDKPLGKINSGNNTPMESESLGSGKLKVLDSLWSPSNHSSAILPPFREGQGSETLTSIASPLPQFSLEDWMASDVLVSFPPNGNVDRTSVAGQTPRFLSPFPGIREEEHVLKSLASFYSAFCLSWWLPRRGMRSKRRNFQHVVNAMERRLRRSEIACTTVAVVAACYGFGNSNSHFDNAIIEPFRQSWERIYEVVCDSKTSSLCAYLDWLGASTSVGDEKSTTDERDRETIQSIHSSLSNRSGFSSPAFPGGMNGPQTIYNDGQQQKGKSMFDLNTKRPRAGSTSDQSDGESEDTSTSLAFSNLTQGHPIEAQADKLFSFASKVLAKVALAAKQDQCISDDILAPLEFAALTHVDVYLQAAMDLALFAFASRPEQIFHRELDAAGSLLESLLGRGQCVRLSEIDGVEAVGFRTFAWTDITNSVLSARCTRLHYLLEDLGKVNEQPDFDVSQPESANLTADDEGEGVDEQRKPKKRRRDVENLRNTAHSQSHRRHRSISISFGCPDDILVIFAHIANLHFQLRQARATGAIKGNGTESLPAWALHTAHDLTRRIEESERLASLMNNNPLETLSGENVQDRSRLQFEEGQRRLAAMWRHAAVIYLYTIAYRIGPLGKTNQERMKGIIDLWTSEDMELNIIENGNPAMPILFAAFIAQQKSERDVCREALKRIGQHEQSRMGYRAFVEKLWCETDERGFALLWHDLLDDSWANKIAIM